MQQFFTIQHIRPPQVSSCSELLLAGPVIVKWSTSRHLTLHASSSIPPTADQLTHTEQASLSQDPVLKVIYSIVSLVEAVNNKRYQDCFMKIQLPVVRPWTVPLHAKCAGNFRWQTTIWRYNTQHCQAIRSLAVLLGLSPGPLLPRTGQSNWTSKTRANPQVWRHFDGSVISTMA